jgi:acetolactate synthase regulatory subunit
MKSKSAVPVDSAVPSAPENNALTILFSALLRSVESSVLPAAQPTGTAPGRTGSEACAERDEGVPGEVAVLLECTGTDAALDQQRVDAFAQAVLEEGVVQDAVLSMSVEQERVSMLLYRVCRHRGDYYVVTASIHPPMMQELWKIREDLTLGLAQLSRSNNPLYHPAAGQSDKLPVDSSVTIQGRLFKYDLSVRLQDTDELLRRLKQRVLAAGFRMKGVSAQATTSPVDSARNDSMNVTRLFSACELEFCNYGHIADQNIHLNILAAVNTSSGGGRPVQIAVPTGGDYANYKKPVAGNAPIEYITASVATDAMSNVAGGVSIGRDSMSVFTALVRGELNRHIFDLVLEMKGRFNLLCVLSWTLYG